MFKRTIVAAALAVVLMAAPAAAQQYPPAVNGLTVSCPTPEAGNTVDIQGQTFAGGSQVTFTLASQQAVIGTAVADSSGTVSAQGVTIPAATPDGVHTITATGQAPDGSPLSISTDITVTAGGCMTGGGGSNPDDEPSGSLPNTGNDSTIPLLQVGLALAAIGGIITAWAAKRRKAARAMAA
jgi:LPXTG-motif cell wall-anchored protein